MVSDSFTETDRYGAGVDGAVVRRFTWIGDDHPDGWERYGSMDLGDPASVTWALDEGLRIGATYDGGSGLYSEPCRADLYRRVPALSKATPQGGSHD